MLYSTALLRLITNIGIYSATHMHMLSVLEQSVMQMHCRSTQEGTLESSTVKYRRSWHISN